MSDEHKIDEAVLALLYLTLHEDGSAWKGSAFSAMNRLHEKGFIGDRSFVRPVASFFRIQFFSALLSLSIMI